MYMEKRCNLDIKSILDTEFHVDYKGYSPLEVDKFLDLVIEDYQFYDERIAAMNEQYLMQERTIASLKAKVIELEGKAKVIDEMDSSQVSNLDLLKRISKLEEIVYKTHEVK